MTNKLVVVGGVVLQVGLDMRAMKRFIFKHITVGDKGFIIGTKIGHYAYLMWIGYGKPIWWKPRFIGRVFAKYGIGFGWIFLCCHVQVYDIRGNIRPR